MKLFAAMLGGIAGLTGLGLASVDRDLPDPVAGNPRHVAATGTAGPAPVRVPDAPVLKSEYFLALTMYHEARGQGQEAMRAVGWVVMNRSRSPQFPDGIRDVVMQPTRSGKCQFGWACGDYDRGLDEDPSWWEARDIAEQVLFDGGGDPTRGAIWFWESWRPRPSWLGPDVRETLEVGGHSFYAPRRLG